MTRPERETASEGSAWQGYANRDTWAVVLNLANDYDAYMATLAWAREAAGDRARLARIARSRFRPYMTDRVSAARVDWIEVAEALAELEEDT